jgi:hypothetical protein
MAARALALLLHWLSYLVVLFKDSVQRDCELVWNDRGVVGVKFISQWFGAKSFKRVSALKNTRARGAA